MRVSAEGLALIREFEGCKLTAYRDPVGILTIGTGHVGPDVKEGMSITQAQADELLRLDVRDAEECIEDHVKQPLTQGQHDSLVSLIFNIGCGAFAKSTLLQRFNVGDVDGARDEFAKWRKAGGKVLAGLERRRAAEAERFAA